MQFDLLLTLFLQLLLELLVWKFLSIMHLKFNFLGSKVKDGYMDETWQIFGDPEAADIVFTCGADVVAVGINVTHQVVLSGRIPLN